jgi:hypothetical protein
MASQFDMTDFDERLKQAIQRGHHRGLQTQDEASLKKAKQDEMRRLHTTMRLQLSERIEKVVHQFIDQFPGFQFSSVYGENGWGAACTRDDLVIVSNQRQSKYSRFEMAVRPLSDVFVLDLQARGTIANREKLVRSYFQPVDEVDLSHFQRLIDDWMVAYAELYSASIAK